MIENPVVRLKHPLNKILRYRMKVYVPLRYTIDFIVSTWINQIVLLCFSYFLIKGVFRRSNGL